MKQAPSNRTKGVLIIEAVVAAFLMVFAFAASASLFDASLRWESQSSNLRRASILAERKMEEIRARASAVPPNTTFASHVDSIITGPHLAYPDAGGFDFTVVTLANDHEPVPTSSYTPANGVHSPCSTLYTQPDNPATSNRVTPVYNFDATNVINLAGDFQKNNRYNTYPYSRSMSNSYRLVKVTCTFGTGGGRSFDLISLIGDPILPPAKPDPNVDQTVTVVRTGGSTNLSSPGGFVEFEIRVKTANNSNVEDVSALWSIHPLTTGTVDIFVLNASGTKVRVTRNALSKTGTSCRLFPQVRYEGIEARAETPDISL